MKGNNWRNKILLALKLGVMGAAIVFIGWLPRGHEMLTGIAVVILALLVAVKIVAAVICRRRGGFGGYPPSTPVAIPPVRPKPPELTGALKG